MTTELTSKGDAQFAYYHHDNASFRRRLDQPGHCVNDVLNEQTGIWVPYKGDRTEPVFYGSRIADPTGGKTERMETAAKADCQSAGPKLTGA